MRAFESLEKYIDEQQTVLDQPFVIDSQDRADWAMSKIGQAQLKIDEAEVLAQRQIERIQSWLSLAKREQQETIDHMTSLLRPFAEERLHGSRKRSMRLPNGSIGFRIAQPKFIRDDEMLLGWARVNSPDVVVISEQVAWNELKKRLTVCNDAAISEDGEIIPGIRVEQQGQSFYVNPERFVIE